MKLHLENKPWTLAVIGAAGTTLLVPSTAALFAPPELLDWLILMGDVRLLFALAGLFAASSCALRVLLRRRRLPEEDVDVETAVAPVRERPVSSRAYLR